MENLVVVVSRWCTYPWRFAWLATACVLTRAVRVCDRWGNPAGARQVQAHQQRGSARNRSSRGPATTSTCTEKEMKYLSGKCARGTNIRGTKWEEERKGEGASTVSRKGYSISSTFSSGSSCPGGGGGGVRVTSRSASPSPSSAAAGLVGSGAAVRVLLPAASM